MKLRKVIGDYLWLETDADGPAPLELPNQWLWDIIDEFIYQVRCIICCFNLFSLNKKTEETKGLRIQAKHYLQIILEAISLQSRLQQHL